MWNRGSGITHSHIANVEYMEDTSKCGFHVCIFHIWCIFHIPYSTGYIRIFGNTESIPSESIYISYVDIGFRIRHKGYGMWNMGSAIHICMYGMYPYMGPHMDIWDLGFGIRDSKYGIWELEFGIWDLGFGI